MLRSLVGSEMCIRDRKFIDSYATYNYFSSKNGATIEPNAIIPVGELNGQSVVLKPETAPDDHTFDLILFHDTQVYRVPITVSFTENLEFNPDILSGPITAENLNHMADVIFTGAALESENQTTDGTLRGSATISVGSWLKGDGAKTVTFGHFGDGADCLETIQLNQPYIFFLNQKGELYKNVRTQGYGQSKWIYSQQNIDALKISIGQEPIEFEFEESLQMAATGEKPLEVKKLHVKAVESIESIDYGSPINPWVIWVGVLGAVLFGLRRFVLTKTTKHDD